MTILQKIIALLIIVVLAFCGGAYLGYTDEHSKWAADKAKTDQQIAELKSKAAQVTIQTVTQYVDRVKTITVQGKTITKYVDRYITPEEDSKCVIPNNFILFLDSAATNTVPPAPINTDTKQ
jgi:uncharacterized protein (UPF0333 family)